MGIFWIKIPTHICRFVTIWLLINIKKKDGKKNQIYHNLEAAKRKLERLDLCTGLHFTLLYAFDEILN